MADDAETRKLATIVALDVAGYSARTEADEAKTVAQIALLRPVIEGIAKAHGGRVFNTAGDGFMLEFGSSLAAVEAANELAAKCKPKVRVGVHLGDVAVQANGDLLGHGVNVAARLMAQAAPGSALVSGAVRQSIRGPIAARLQSRGVVKLDKMAETIEAFALSAESAVVTPASIPSSDMPARDDNPASSPSPSDTRASLAVLPFDTFGSANGLQNIADGLVEELLTMLSQFSELTVIARTSSFCFRGPRIDVPSIAKTLKVRYIVEGSVRDSGQKLRFSAQLIDATSGAHIWADRYDRVGIEIIKVQEEVAAEIVQRILPNMWRSEIGRVRRSAPRSLDSWGRSIRAFFGYHERPTPAAAANALQLVQTALEEDPNYGFAHAVMACLLAEVGSLPITPAATEARSSAEQHAAEALRLAEGDPLVLLMCGLVPIHLGRPSEALYFLNRAYAMCPNHAHLRFARGLALIMTGALAEGLAEFDVCERLSPIDVVLYRLLVFRSAALFELARDEEAAREIDRSLHLQPNYPLALAFKAGMLACAGQLDAAVARAKAAATEMTVPFAIITAGIRLTLPNPDVLHRISGGWREVEALIDRATAKDHVTP